MPMALLAKNHHRPDGMLLVAVCDKEIAGKRFTEGHRQLDLSSAFYTGTEVSKEEAARLFSKATHINLAGKEAVALGVEMEYIDPARVLTVCRIPYAESNMLSG